MREAGSPTQGASVVPTSALRSAPYCPFFDRLSGQFCRLFDRLSDQIRKALVPAPSRDWHRTWVPTLTPSHRLQVWDIATCACKHTLSHHSGKVQSVAWNVAQPSVLLSGGFDQAAFVVRCAPSPVP